MAKEQNRAELFSNCLWFEDKAEDTGAGSLKATRRPLSIDKKSVLRRKDTPQVVKHLLCKHEVLSSNPSLTKKKKRDTEETQIHTAEWKHQSEKATVSVTPTIWYSGKEKTVSRYQGLGGREKWTGRTREFQDSETTPYHTIMTNTCCYSFVKIHRMYGTKNRPYQ
jgi:hypothetical protein